MIPEQFKQFEIKDSVAVEGIDENFVWYESQLLNESMRAWSYRFEKMVRVMEARHKEHLAMLAQVMNENRDLKRQLKEKQNGQ